MNRRLRQLRTIGLYFLIPALGAAAPLLVLPAISSRFGAAGWGAVAVAQSVGGALAIIGELGWGVVGPQRVAGAKNPADRMSIYRSALATKMLSVAVMAPIAGLLTYHLNSIFRWETALLAMGIALGALSPTWFFIGEGRPSRVLLADSLPRVLVNLLSAGVLVAGAPLLVYAVTMLATPFVTLTIASALIGRTCRLRRDDVRGAPAVIRRQLVMAAGRTVSVVYTTLPIAMVAVVAPALVPVFSASERLMRMSLTILSGVPSRLQSWIGSAEGAERQRRSRRSVALNLVLGLICGAGFGLLAPTVARFVFAGEIVLPYRVSLLSGLLLAVICTSRGLGLSLVAAGRADYITLAIIAAALSGSATIIPFSLALGVIGPVLGELFAETVGLGAQALLLRRKREEPGLGKIAPA